LCKAAITGDFVLLASQVNPAIKALRDNGIESDGPTKSHAGRDAAPVFMHFWANDDAQKLARGLRAALDKVKVAKS
jgi:Domain of Unknown Function (DUF1259)